MNEAYGIQDSSDCCSSGRGMSDVGSCFPDLIIKLKQARASVWFPL